MTKEEILSLLKMGEYQQWDFLWKKGIIKHHHESLADCAFRLRDEATGNNGDYLVRNLKWIEAKNAICEVSDTPYNRLSALSWGDVSRPIHWIVAALLARLAEGEAK